jgi:hypothetical protein
MRQLLVVLIAIVSIPAWGDTPDFDAGQLWAYKTRVGEEDSRLLIDKVEDVPKLGRIFHISLSNIHLKDSAVTIATELPHLPVSLQTLTSSCTTLVGHSEPNPMYLQGYQTWRKAFDAGQAGVYTISIAEILNTTEALLKRRASGDLSKSNFRSSGRAMNKVPTSSP